MGVCGSAQQNFHKDNNSVKKDKKNFKNESKKDSKIETKKENPKSNSKIKKYESKNDDTKIETKKEMPKLNSNFDKNKIKNESKNETKIETKKVLPKSNSNFQKNVIKNDTKNEIPKMISKIENKEIIRECHVKGTSPIIPEEISDILKKSTARIEFNDEKKTSTGFFMKINIKGEKINFILTCNHSITQEDIDSKQQINIYFGKSGNEEKIVITLDVKNRLIKTYEDLDVTLIQILREDKIQEKRFLYPDLNYKNVGFSIYKDSQVFTAGYPNIEFYKEGRHISSGIITKISHQFNFEHNCDTRKGSSGSPIINKAKLVIGIHFGGDKKNEKNFGTFIGAIIDKLTNEGEKIIIKKEEEAPKKVNQIVSLLKNEIHKDDPKKDKENKEEIIDSFLPILNCPELIHHFHKLLSNQKIMNLLNKPLSLAKDPIVSNLANDIKDLFDEDNLEPFNDLKNSFEHIKNKLNEEDKKE